MNSRFVVLTGHLSDYPLPDLIGILRHQQKTGRLLIEYPKAPASFFFEEGDLIDVQLDGLVGLQAICVAMAEPAAPFNFNPLIRTSQKSIDSSLQKVVSELFGCWDETPLHLDTVVVSELPAEAERPELPTTTAAVRSGETLALPPFIAPPRQTRTILAMAAAGLLLLGISSLIAVSGSFQNKVESVSLAASPNENIPLTPPKNSEAPPLISRNEDVKTPNVATEPRKAKETASLPTERRKETKQNRVSNDSVAVVDTAEGSETSQPREQVAKDTTEAKPTNEAKIQLVDVVMRIENGRVLQASIANHKPGMDGYEALALRIARQRRYSGKTNGHEIVTIRVTQPD